MVAKRVVAVVSMDWSGRVITVGNEELVTTSRRKENRFFKVHGVTHVVCQESFSDLDEHPAQEYLNPES